MAGDGTGPRGAAVCRLYCVRCSFTDLVCRRILVWHASKKVTTLGAADLQEKRHILCRRINNWREVQRAYMPCIDQLLTASAAIASDASQDSASTDSSRMTTTPEQPEMTPLFLPSSISPSLWATGCVLGLVDKERRLRLAQADDGLNELRRQLRISATLRDYKKVQIGGTSQKMNTRARSLLSRFHDKTIRCAERYSAAYKALSILDPKGDWTIRLRFLDHKKDLRSPRRDDDDESRETKRELSWIWLVPREGGPPSAVASADEINDSRFNCSIFLSLFRPHAWVVYLGFV
jgi:hypothetical protein